MRLQVARRERDGVAVFQSFYLDSDGANKRLSVGRIVQSHVNLDNARVPAEGRDRANLLGTLNEGGEAADANMGEEQFRSYAPELTAGLVAVPNAYRVWSRLRRAQHGPLFTKGGVPSRTKP